MKYQIQISCAIYVNTAPVAFFNTVTSWDVSRVSLNLRGWTPYPSPQNFNGLKSQKKYFRISLKVAILWQLLGL